MFSGSSRAWTATHSQLSGAPVFIANITESRSSHFQLSVNTSSCREGQPPGWGSLLNLPGWLPLGESARHKVCVEHWPAGFSESHPLQSSVTSCTRQPLAQIHCLHGWKGSRGTGFQESRDRRDLRPESEIGERAGRRKGRRRRGEAEREGKQRGEREKEISLPPRPCLSLLSLLVKCVCHRQRVPGSLLAAEHQHLEMPAATLWPHHLSRRGRGR